jgi:tetratricopeptide (TPR) repeat protein
MPEETPKTFEPNVQIILQTFFIEDLATFRKILQIPTTLPDNVVLQHKGSLRRFVEKFRTHRLSEALEYYREGASLLDVAGATAFKALMITLASYAEAVLLVQNGDLHGARDLLGTCKKYFEAISNLIPSWTIYGEGLEANLYLVAGKLELSKGRIDEAFALFAKCNNLYDGIRNKYGEDAIDPDFLCEVVGAPVEIGMARAQLLLYEFDYKEALLCLARVSESRGRLGKLSAKLNKGLQKSLVEAVTEIFDAQKLLTEVLDSYFSGKRKLSAKDANNLISIRTSLRKAEQHALVAESKGTGSLEMIKQLTRYSENFFRLNKPSFGSSFSYVNNVVFVGSLVAFAVLSRIFHIGDVRNITYVFLLVAVSIITAYGKDGVDLLVALSAFKGKLSPTTQKPKETV